MFLLILFGFWICFLAFYYFSFGKKNKQVLTSTALLFAGLIIPVASVIFYFAYHNALGELWYTTFVYPADAVIEITGMENRGGVLINGLVWFFKSYFPVILLTLIFLSLNLKSFSESFRRPQNLNLHNLLFVNLVLWFFLSFAVIMIQRLSWWEYHYSLLMIPLGILSAKCLEETYEILRTFVKSDWKNLTNVALTLFILILFFPVERRLINKIRQSVEVEQIKIGDRDFGVTGDAVEDYKSISADVEFLTNEKPKTTLFVVSNPLYYYLTDLPPVFSSNGAMSDMFTDFEWSRLDREMSENLPEYIFIETRFLQPIAIENAVFSDIVKNKYSVIKTGERGSFYKLNK